MSIGKRGSGVLPIITVPRCDEPSHLRPKITFFFDSQRLMALSPSPAHESLLLILTADLNDILRTIPIPSAIAYCQAGSNTFHQGDSINGVPDLTVQVWHEGRKAGTIMSETIWVMECAFSQSDRDVTKKLRAYVQDLPGLLLVGKILFKPELPFRSPGANRSIARNLRSLKPMTFAEWTDYASAEGFSLVTADGHTWFSISSVQFHLWIRKPGESKIRMDCFDEDSYAYGVRPCFVFQRFSTDNIEHSRSDDLPECRTR